MKTLAEFLTENKSDMRENLESVLNHCKKYLNDEIESIDIRLCIDKTSDSFDFIFRTGSSDYDQRHSEFCAASSFDNDTKTDKLLETLISQIEEY